MKKLSLPALALLLPLSGCGGLHPLYGGGGDGTVARTLAAVQVDPVAGKNGWLVTNALRDRLNTQDGIAPRYRLAVALDDDIIGLGVRRDDAITRERRTLRARYQLIDLSTGAVVLDDTAGSDAGIDVVGSEYATIAAEESALERLANIVANQIVGRIARYGTTESGDGS
ncbi:LPS assembly lipoprotein LptE [Stakelama saccharophila]|uniref:LPS assembly lipoprotein LptE n=1 Tax=Stakelama saccharophila TaxID=3075605 RepID=A0ABZ0B9P7_9SPHN|nr:LPS assembly lipoprotein LptE [Stakelama sp. W311]WNO54015.1 LPS assembly lipoprotein LptE [Stakelama sp. W311]